MYETNCGIGLKRCKTDEIKNKYLFAIDDSELSAWKVLARACNVELVEKVWEWAKKQQTAEELNCKLFLFKYIREKSA
jgi:hypothetical protein